jgi:hypothetical protein
MHRLLAIDVPPRRGALRISGVARHLVRWQLFVSGEVGTPRRRLRKQEATSP